MVSEVVSHLHPVARAVLDHSEAERTAWIRTERWIGYPRAPHALTILLESGEFCKKTKLNTRGYPCTLGVPTQSVDQKGYPLAQAHCTPFAQSCSLFVWFAPASE